MCRTWLLLYTGDQWTQSTVNTDAGSFGYHGIKLLPAMLNLFFDVVKLSEGWSRMAEKDSSANRSVGNCTYYSLRRAAFACVIYYFIMSWTPLG